MLKKEQTLFFRWLKEQGIYADYIKEVSKNRKFFKDNTTLKDRFSSVPLEEAINYNLIWESTRLGHSFWSDKDTKLRHAVLVNFAEIKKII